MTPDALHLSNKLTDLLRERGFVGDPFTPETVEKMQAAVLDHVARSTAPLAIGELAEAIHELHEKKGFYAEPRTVSHLMGLVMTELAEVIEDDRKFDSDQPSEKIPEFTKEEEEVADAVIRLLDFAGHRKLRIGAAVVAKHEYNAGRPPLHNKRY